MYNPTRAQLAAMKLKFEKLTWEKQQDLLNDAANMKFGMTYNEALLGCMTTAAEDKCRKYLLKVACTLM